MPFTLSFCSHLESSFEGKLLLHHILHPLKLYLTIKPTIDSQTAVRYSINKYREYITITYGQKEINVRIHFGGGWSPNIYEFYSKDELLIKTERVNTLFTTKLNILHNNIGKELLVYKQGSNRGILYNGAFFHVKRHYFKNPLYTLYKNDVRVGEVKTALFGVLIPPINYDVKIELEDSLEEFILVLLLIVQLPLLQEAD